MSVLIGGSGNDSIVGTSGDDYLLGHGGNDSLVGLAGDDTLDGGAGNDYLRHDLGDDLVYGREGDDYLGGGEGNDTLLGGPGDDDLTGGHGDDYLDGGPGDDWMISGSGLDVLGFGSGHGNDTISDFINGDDRIELTGLGVTTFDELRFRTAQGGVELDLTAHGGGTIFLRVPLASLDASDFIFSSSLGVIRTGTSGDDSLVGTTGDDTLRGLGGNDTLEGASGADRLDGGAGTDLLSYWNSDAGVEVNLASGSVSGGHAQGDTINGFENVLGSRQHGDRLTGDGGSNWLHGGGGADRLAGGGGDDTLEGGAGADRLDGGAGTDLLSYWNSDAGVEVNLASGSVSGGHAQGDTISGFEGIRGSAHADSLTGGGGDDTLEGGAGADRLDGGAGDDVLSYWNSDAGVEVNLATGRASGGDAQGDTIRGFEHVWGSRGNDTLTGDSGDNWFSGGAGADRISGGDGFDSIESSTGADVLDGGGGDRDGVFYRFSDAGVYVSLATGRGSGGHADGDTLRNIERAFGSPHDDTLVGDSGDNLLRGNAGADQLDGGGGFDTVSYWTSGSAVKVDLSTRFVSGGDAEGDTIRGFEAINGSAHDDTLTGNYADNLLHGRGGGDLLEGGAGFDTVSYVDSDSAVDINLATRVVSGGHAEGDTISGFEAILGSEHADTLASDGGDNRLEGGLGADRFVFGQGHGADTIGDFSDGEDRIDLSGLGVSSLGEIRAVADGQGGVLLGLTSAGGGTILLDDFDLARLDASDFIFSSSLGVIRMGTNGNDRLSGSAGDDFIYGYGGGDTLYGQNGDDHIFGGGGNDRIRGGAGADFIEGGVDNDNLFGDNGDDTLEGEEGNDGLFGGGGDDVLWGGAGNDVHWGGTGNDLLVGGEGDDRFSAQQGEDTLRGGSGHDTLASGSENDRLYGDGHNDRLFGQAGHDSLDGGTGNDTLVGGSGNDQLVGSAGNDSFFGQTGNDRLIGGSGNDVLRGQNGADTFVFASGHGADTITDFTDGLDRIDVSALSVSGIRDVNAWQSASGVHIDLVDDGGGTILLRRFDLSDLDSGDFLF